MDSSSKPTPPAGTPIPTSTADPLERLFLAVEAVQRDVAATRAESRMRGEETREEFDKLNRKVDTLTKDDEQLRLADRRLEHRIASTDEEFKDFQKEVRADVKELREELRKDREERSKSDTSIADTVSAMQRHIEKATDANTITITTAVAHLTDATKRFDEASATARSNESTQDTRIGAVEKKVDGVEVTLTNQNVELAQIKTMISSIAKALGNPRLRWALLGAAVIGAAIGGGVAGYIGERETAKTSAPAR